MKIFVINAGSSSLKYQLIDMTDEHMLIKGICERIGFPGSVLKQKRPDGKNLEITQDLANHSEALKLVFKTITDPEYGVIKSLDEVAAFGHRVLHGAEDFSESVIVDEHVLEVCDRNTEFGPLHMPANVGCIRACMALMPDRPQVAVFDTTFHSTMLPRAYLYGIPYDLYKQHHIRKYGFHGTSHKFISEEAAKYFGRDDLNLITCHLGNGASIAAVSCGQCKDTSMGFTPLEGLIMGTRSGDIDPAAVEFMRKKLNLEPEQMIDYLNKKCGMLGISGTTPDFRDLADMMEAGDEQAKLAIEMFAYRIRKYIGSYSVVLGRVDAIILTGGIGENNYRVRGLCARGLECMGAYLDPERNKIVTNGIEEISTDDSAVKILVIPTNEELEIARDTLHLVQGTSKKKH